MTDIGRQFEAEFARALDAKQQPGSGNTPWAKLDVRGSSILWSCKATKRGTQSITISKYDLREAEEAVNGPNGTGDLPGVALEIDGEVHLMMKADDFLTLMGSDVTIDGTKAAKKRRAAQLPAALRGDD